MFLREEGHRREGQEGQALYFVTDAAFFLAAQRPCHRRGASRMKQGSTMGSTAGGSPQFTDGYRSGTDLAESVASVSHLPNICWQWHRDVEDHGETKWGATVKVSYTYGTDLEGRRTSVDVEGELPTTPRIGPAPPEDARPHRLRRDRPARQLPPFPPHLRHADAG